MRPVGLGDHQQAGRILVEPMDDPDERLPSAMAEREITSRPRDQGISLAVGSRLGEKTCGLIHDQDVWVFVEDLEAACDLPRLGAIREEFEARVGRDLATGFVAAFAFEVDSTVAHRLLRGSTGETEAVGNQFIQADRHGRGLGRQVSRGLSTKRMLGRP